MNSRAETVPLADFVSKVVGGGTPARAVADNWTGPIPWASVKDLTEGELALNDTQEHISLRALHGSATNLIPAGIPIVCTRMAVGRVGVPAVDMAINQDLKALFPASGIDIRYLIHGIQFLQPRLEAVATGSTVKGLQVRELLVFRLLKPVDHEQRRIAEILDTLDDQISATKRIVSKLNSVQVGLMRSLLGTRSVGPSATRQRDIPVPPGWRSLALADVVGAPITYGIVQAGPDVPGGVPYVRTGDMSGDRLSAEGMLRTSQRIANSYARSTVHVGELVCAIRATVGKVLPVPPELDGANLTQGTARIAPGRSIDPRFLYWEMCGERVQDQIALVIKGTTFFEITLAALRQVRVAMPSLPAQREIAEVLDTQEDLVLRESGLLAHLQALKAGLMDDLLTGRVRVPEGAAS
jgi:type I restriction enzyme, S subunit